MSAIRGRMAERCISPNEHVELIRELESRYAEMLKPIRDLNKNFAVSLDVLEKYIHEVKQISIETINFANAGLILQSSKEVYARKVDYLEKLFEDLQKTAYNVKRTEKDDEDNPDENAKSKRAKKRKAMVDGLDEYKLISPDDIPQLADGGEMNFNNVGLTYITQLRACLLKPEVSVHVELRDVNGDLIGRKNDFRVNWPINQDGMPCDLTLCYYEERKRNRPLDDRVCDEVSDREDDGMCHDDPPATPLRNSPTESMFGHPDVTSTPAVARTDLPTLDSATDPLLASTENDASALDELEHKSKRKVRAKKLPSEMTLGEFLHGKKRRSKTNASNKTEKRNKRREKNAQELQEQRERAAATVEEVVAMFRVVEGDVKDEGVVGLSRDKLAEASSMMTAAPDVFTPPEGKPEDGILEKPPPPATSPRDAYQMVDVPEVKDDGFGQSATDHRHDNCESGPAACSIESSYCDRLGDEAHGQPESPVESVVGSVMDTGFSDDDLDVPRRDGVPQASTSSHGADNVDQATGTIIEDGQVYKTGILELDPMNQRIRAWEDRIIPILEEQATRTKFRLPDYANRLLGKMHEGDAVPCFKLVSSTSKHEVSRNFVALLHLCNTRNVEMQNGNISLLSREYRLSAEDIESYE